MSLNMDENQSQSRRPVGLGIIGLLLLMGAGYVYYGVMQRKPVEVAVPSSYQYTVDQNVKTDVQYFESSFYENGPGAANSAYIAELTDKIAAQFVYDYKASKAEKISYTYAVTSSIRGLYSLKDAEKAQPTVWTKEFQLVEPTSRTVNTKSFSVEPEVDIPFAEYKKKIDQLNTALSLSLTSEAVITFTMKVSGTVDGSQFRDIKSATVTAPLNQQLYSLAVKYEKHDTGQVAAKNGSAAWDITQHYEEIFALVLGLIGLVLTVVGFRKQIFKSPYQRELDRIYRLHDGIIVRANKQTDLEDRKVVSVQSFEDMLNLEEELKVPIVASPAGGEAMHFIIMRDDVAYVYTLGKVILEEDSMRELEKDLPDDELPKRRKATRRKIQ